MMRIDVPVQEVEAAVRFYCRAFEGAAGTADAQGTREIDLGGVVLRILDVKRHVQNEVDLRFYEQGRTPRLEFRVDDVGARIARAVEAGATLRVRLPADADNRGIEYAQMLDPFGHLWALARE